MKARNWLATVLCVLLPAFTFLSGCDVLAGLFKTPDDTDEPAIDQPAEDEKGGEKEEEGGDKEEEPPQTHIHNLTYKSKVKATCTEDGTVARWECSGCFKSFTDKTGKKEIENTVIKATGHKFSESWTSNDTHHWHGATCAHKDEIKDKAPHSYDDEGLCVCGKKDTAERTCGKFTAADFLKTDGADVKTKSGKRVFLRGINAGGLFVTEPYMSVFGNDGDNPDDDYKSVTQTFIERFGEQKTKALWAEYRANWWTDADFKNCVDMGMNVIRLPFTYMNVDFAAITDYEEAGKNYDFSALDDFVQGAAEYGLYVILDLHGAYGSQNGQDHSGEIFGSAAEVDFYANERMQELTVKLWRALAAHYKYNPAVAGYDILNEPGEKGGSTSSAHWKFYDKVYKAIRAENDNHIVIFESCWEWYNLPKPSQYGWTNCMYSFHHYISDKLSADGHISNWQSKLSGIENQNFGLPLQMGEFTAYNSIEKWQKTLELLNKNNWHYTSWTYKVWVGGNWSSSWGVYNVRCEKVDPANDSYETIINKCKKLRTSDATKFGEGGKTLESVFKEYLL